MKRLALTGLMLLFAACASTSDVEKLQDQVVELQEELAATRRTTAAKEDVQSVNQRIADQTEQLLRSNAALITRVDQLEERVQNAQGLTEQGGYRMDQIARDLADLRAQVEALKASAPVPPTPAVGEVTVPAPATSVAENPIDIYNAAYRDYQKGNFDLAIQGFREFLQTNAASDLGDNAAYWIGESLFSQKKYQDAIAQFDSVVTRYPRSDKVPGALLKKGFSYIALGERAQGIVQLQYVVHEHPTSQEASLARQRLRQLGVETR
jgi:tol-pal system protein YbgF